MVERLEGVIGLGPESMYFHSCSTGRVSWLHQGSFEAHGWVQVAKELDRRPTCDLRTMPCKHQLAFVAVDAKIKEGGSYGHLGKYESEVRVVSVHKVQPFAGQCPL